MGALPGEVNTTSPAPSSSSRCLSPSCPSGLLVVLTPWAALVLFVLRAKRWVRSSPMQVCVSWLSPFTPRQPLPRARGAGTACVGGQGPSAAPHGLGKCRRTCPVKCSVTPVREGPRGLGQPGALAWLGALARAALGSQGRRKARQCRGAVGATWR